MKLKELTMLRFLPGLIVLAAMLSFSLLALGVGHAQEQVPTQNITAPAAQETPADEPLLGAFFTLRAVEGRLDDLVPRLSQADLDEGALLELRDLLDMLRTQLDETSAELLVISGELEVENKKLGPEPEDDSEASNPLVSAKRKSLKNRSEQLALAQVEIDTLLKRLGEAEGTIVDRRREIFSEVIFNHRPLLFDSWENVQKSFSRLLVGLSQNFRNWVNYISTAKQSQFLFSTLISLIIAAVLGLGVSVLSRKRTRLSSEEHGEENYALDRLVKAFWAFAVPSGSLGIFLFSTYQLYQYFDIINLNTLILVEITFITIGSFYFLYRLLRAVLAPARPAYRLLPCTDKGAWLLLICLTSIAFVATADHWLTGVIALYSKSLQLTLLASALTTTLVGLFLLFLSFINPFAPAQVGIIPSLWSRFGRIFFFILGLGLLVLVVSGFVGLANFVGDQVVITGAILLAVLLGFQAALALGEPEIFTRTWLGKGLLYVGLFSKRGTERFGFVFSRVLALALLIFGLPFVLLQWGFQLEDIIRVYSAAFFGFSVGSVTISISTVLAAMVLFFLGYFFTRLFQRWFDKSFLSRTDVEVGIRDSVRTGIGYVGIALAMFIAVTSTGLDLSSLALVAGALSLGIGFGLQNIVSNFVSGLILLIERPIKNGDWVVVGGHEGTVKKISVRATEIESFQGQSVIVPNSELINNPLGNWTHKYRGGRTELAVSVAYGTDPIKVKTILEEIGARQEYALRTPPPEVVFIGFGESSLDFQLRVYLYDVSYRFHTASNMRFQVVEAFAEAGLEMPFPQRDLHIKSMPEDASKIKPASASEGARKIKPASEGASKIKLAHEGED